MAQDKYNEIQRNLFLAKNSTSSHWALLVAIIAVSAIVLLA